MTKESENENKTFLMQETNGITSKTCRALKYSKVSKGHCVATAPEVSWKKTKFGNDVSIFYKFIENGFVLQCREIEFLHLYLGIWVACSFSNSQKGLKNCLRERKFGIRGGIFSQWQHLQIFKFNTESSQDRVGEERKSEREADREGDRESLKYCW